MKMLKCFYIYTLALCMLFHGVAFAAESVVNSNIEETIERCANDGGTPGAIALCLEREDYRLGQKLQSTYDGLINSFKLENGAFIETLRRSQRAWLKLQEEDCSLSRALIEYEGKEFSQLSYSKCRLQFTISRINTLINFSDMMKGGRNKSDNFDWEGLWANNRSQCECEPGIVDQCRSGRGAPPLRISRKEFVGPELSCDIEQVKNAAGGSFELNGKCSSEGQEGSATIKGSVQKNVLTITVTGSVKAFWSQGNYRYFSYKCH